ncbi:Rrf2 family transcriptional regulator [Pontiellaceae bacterium B12219]|nr:Rrf2 family transcriptional regulator [Pontiellaceae bacterium B12219]
MHLKQNTDYSLRILMYAATHRDEMVSAREICEFYDISYSHTVKIVNKLGKLGYLELKRGRYGGGIALAIEPEAIDIGTVVRQFESNMDVVECFDPDTNTCSIAGGCRLKFFFQEALDSFFNALDGKTLAEVLPPQK